MPTAAAAAHCPLTVQPARLILWLLRPLELELDSARCPMPSRCGGDLDFCSYSSVLMIDFFFQFLHLQPCCPPNDIMGSSTSKSQQPLVNQTEVQPSVPAASLSFQPDAPCSLVLNDANLLTMILILAASTGLHRSHKVFMMEACNTTISEIAQQKRDELWACIRQVCCLASADARA